MDGSASESRPGNPARGVRLGEMPTVSLLLTSRGARARLERCLSKLMQQRSGDGVEIVVARAGEVLEVEELRAAYPEVRFCLASPGTSDADLRVVGMVAVSGDIVFLRPDDPVPDNWLAQMVEAHQKRAKGLSE
jgi:hypothetical protein